MTAHLAAQVVRVVVLVLGALCIFPLFAALDLSPNGLANDLTGVPV